MLLADLGIPEIKKILRGCEVDSTDILAAKTKIELIELAKHNGITGLPDEWTIAKIKQKRQEAKDDRNKQVVGLSGAANVAEPVVVVSRSFFSQRPVPPSPRTQAALTDNMDMDMDTPRPGVLPNVAQTMSGASRTAARRLERAKGRASERLTPKAAPANGQLRGAPAVVEAKLQARRPGLQHHPRKQRGSTYRTLDELVPCGFTDEMHAAVLAARNALGAARLAALPPPPPVRRAVGRRRELPSA